MAEANHQNDPEACDSGQGPCKARRKGGRRGQYLAQSPPPICDARRDGSGNQTDDRAQSQQDPDLLG